MLYLGPITHSREEAGVQWKEKEIQVRQDTQELRRICALVSDNHRIV